MQEYTQHYLKAGGKQSFLSIALPLMTPFFCSSLKENIVFSQHNLATDSSFNEFNVILPNVLIYFNQLLQFTSCCASPVCSVFWDWDIRVA